MRWWVFLVSGVMLSDVSPLFFWTARWGGLRGWEMTPNKWSGVKLWQKKEANLYLKASGNYMRTARVLVMRNLSFTAFFLFHSTFLHYQWGKWNDYVFRQIIKGSNSLFAETQIRLKSQNICVAMMAVNRLSDTPNKRSFGPSKWEGFNSQSQICTVTATLARTPWL